jgi:VanZ family protein
LAISIFLGWLIEFLQGYFPSLGRSKEFMDIVADAIGALIGVVVFYIGAQSAKEK